MHSLMLVLVIAGHAYMSAEHFPDRAACETRAEEVKAIGVPICLDAATQLPGE